MATAITRPISFRRPQIFYVPPEYTEWRKISGVTKDSAGVALPGCTVKLFRTIDDQLVRTVISDATGQYWFDVANDGKQYYIVSYLAGGTPVAGTTVNTLTGVGA